MPDNVYVPNYDVPGGANSNRQNSWQDNTEALEIKLKSTSAVPPSPRRKTTTRREALEVKLSKRKKSERQEQQVRREALEIKLTANCCEDHLHPREDV